MKKRVNLILSIAIMVIFLITACSSSVNTPSDLVGNNVESPAIETRVTDLVDEDEVSTDNDVEDPGMDAMADEVGDTQVPVKDTPAWFDIPMVDVRTGQSFTINDQQGKVVLVETLAMWCSSCLKQQKEVKVLHERLSGEESFISIGLDIDINEEAQDLKTYTENNQFDWLYVISPVEVAREISDLYGAQFLNPPSTPILVIDKSGEVHLMPFGIKTADELYDFVAPFLYQ